MINVGKVYIPLKNLAVEVESPRSCTFPTLLSRVNLTSFTNILFVLDKVKPAQSSEDNSASAPAAEPETAKKSSSAGRRGRFSKEKSEAPIEEASSTAAPARTGGRRFHGKR